MTVKYSKEEINSDLMEFLWDAAGELTDTFFRVVDREAPVEDGHLHESFATALDGLIRFKLLHIADTQASMSVKGSNDPEAKRGGTGVASKFKTGVTVLVRNDLGFVERLNSGGTQEADVTGNQGRKTEGAATVGQLYAPRSEGRDGVLMWMDGGTRRYARTRTIQPHGFFDAAEQAVVTLAKEMGFA